MRYSRKLERPRRRWENDIKETECENLERIYTTKDRDRWWALVNSVMNPRVL
jgi:hypothetical protein